jgi:hypothetical protein
MHSIVSGIAKSAVALIGVGLGAMVVGKLPAFPFSDIVFAILGLAVAAVAMHKLGEWAKEFGFGFGLGMALPVLKRIPVIGG